MKPSAVLLLVFISVTFILKRLLERSYTRFTASTHSSVNCNISWLFCLLGIFPLFILTPRSTVLFEKLTSPKLLKKFSAFCRTRRFLIALTRARWLQDLFKWVVTWLIFYGEKFLLSRPNPKLEDYPLSAVRDCLFNNSQLPSISGGRSSIRNLRTRHAVVTGTHLSGPFYLLAAIIRRNFGAECIILDSKF